MLSSYEEEEEEEECRHYADARRDVREKPIPM